MNPIIVLILQATLPVAIGIAIAGWAARGAGQFGLWLALFLTLCVAAYAWGAGWEAPFAQRFLAPLSVYVPPLLLGGIGLNLLGANRWRVVPVLLLAFGVAITNIVLAQVFFVFGCSAQLWDCP